MNRVAYTPRAKQDIEDIWDYTAKTWGPDQADRYVDDIASLCIELARGSKSGRRVYVRPGYLKHAVGKHLVFFQSNDGGIVVVRVLHQSMDVGQHI